MPATLRLSSEARRRASDERPAIPGVLIAVGKALVRQGLARLLETSGRAVRACQASRVEETRDWMQRDDFDILLIDDEQMMAFGETELRGAGARRTLLVTPREHVGEQPVAGRGQACGMLSESDSEACVEALLRTLSECGLDGYDGGNCGGCLAQQTWQKARLPLSPREYQVFLRIGESVGPRQIASELGVSVKTVESHREKIKQKLQLASGDALLCAAVRWREGYYLRPGRAD